jgi:hypothetical protein
VIEKGQANGRSLPVPSLNEVQRSGKADTIYLHDGQQTVSNILGNGLE